ncbi:hypothetical protein OAM69_02285 [bacterium]|nr:hypothetical protein [bacterium]
MDVTIIEPVVFHTRASSGKNTKRSITFDSTQLVGVTTHVDGWFSGSAFWSDTRKLVEVGISNCSNAATQQRSNAATQQRSNAAAQRRSGAAAQRRSDHVPGLLHIPRHQGQEVRIYEHIDGIAEFEYSDCFHFRHFCQLCREALWDPLCDEKRASRYVA